MLKSFKAIFQNAEWATLIRQNHLHSDSVVGTTIDSIQIRELINWAQLEAHLAEPPLALVTRRHVFFCCKRRFLWQQKKELDSLGIDAISPPFHIRRWAVCTFARSSRSPRTSSI